MKWNKFRLKTTTEAEDIVSSMLMDLGVQGIEIEDKIPMTQAENEQMFVDILPETGINDGIAYISFYLEEDEDKESLLEAVKNELEDMVMERCRFQECWKMWTGSITGKNIFTSSMWMIS